MKSPKNRCGPSPVDALSVDGFVDLMQAGPCVGLWGCELGFGDEGGTAGRGVGFDAN